MIIFRNLEKNSEMSNKIETVYHLDTLPKSDIGEASLLIEVWEKTITLSKKMEIFFFGK